MLEPVRPSLLHPARGGVVGHARLIHDDRRRRAVVLHLARPQDDARLRVAGFQGGRLGVAVQEQHAVHHQEMVGDLAGRAFGIDSHEEGHVKLADEAIERFNEADKDARVTDSDELSNNEKPRLRSREGREGRRGYGVAADAVLFAPAGVTAGFWAHPEAVGYMTGENGTGEVVYVGVLLDGVDGVEFQNHASNCSRSFSCRSDVRTWGKARPMHADRRT